jgi:ribosomal protein S19
MTEVYNGKTYSSVAIDACCHIPDQLGRFGNKDKADGNNPR